MEPKKQEPLTQWIKGSVIMTPADDLLSRNLSEEVPSAMQGLASLFGMGKGVSPSLMASGKTVFHVTRSETPQ